MDLVSSENTGEKHASAKHWAGKGFAEDFCNLQLAEGPLFI